MFKMDDIIALIQKANDENKVLKICMGNAYMIVEPGDSLNILKPNATLIQVKDNLDVSCDQTIIDLDSITHIKLLNGV